MEPYTQMLPVVGKNVVSVDANDIECLIRYDVPEAGMIVENAKKRALYINYVADPGQIRTLIVMSSGRVYASTVKAGTLARRMEKTGIPTLSIIGVHSLLAVHAIESFLQLDHDILEQASRRGDYMDIFRDRTEDKMGQKIRCLVMMDNGHIYPSTFNIRTLKKKCGESTAMPE